MSLKIFGVESKMIFHKRGDEEIAVVVARVLAIREREVVGLTGGGQQFRFQLVL